MRGVDRWHIYNVPPTTKAPDDSLCTHFSPSQGCGFDPRAGAGHECDAVSGGPGAAMRDHEIFAITWSNSSDIPRHVDSSEGGPILSAVELYLSNGEPGSPLVWSPRLSSPLGQSLRDVGLRVVNRTTAYRCKPTSALPE